MTEERVSRLSQQGTGRAAGQKPVTAADAAARRNGNDTEGF